MNSKTLVAAFCAASLTLALSGTAFAQGMAMKKMPMGQTAGQITQTTIDENDKVSAVDVVAKPGDTSPMQSRPMRVVHFRAPRIMRIFGCIHCRCGEPVIFALDLS